MKTNKSYLLIAAVLTLLFILPPTHTLAQETIVDRLDKKLDVKLPNDYETKVKEFLDTCFWNVKSKDNNTMRDIKTRMQNFTEQFIVEQMKNDWGIDRQNQLLFIWDKIICIIIGKSNNVLFDGNTKRQQDFKKAVSHVRNCREKYKEGIMPLVNEVNAEYDRRIAEAQQRSAEAQQRSAEAQQRSAEAQQRGAEAITSSLDNLVWFYNRYKKDPSTILEGEIKQWKELCKKVVSRCKEENIDHKAKLSKDMLKFYGIE